MTATAEILANLAREGTRRVGPATSKRTFTGPGGLTWTGVDARPAELAAACKGDPVWPEASVQGVYTAARNCRSEEGSERGGVGHLLAIAELVRNEAKATGRSVHDTLVYRTTAAYAFTRGYYGSQRGRWAATGSDPRERDIAAAYVALYHGGSELLPRDATSYYDPQAFDRQGAAKQRWGDIVFQRWTDEGKEWIGPVVVDGHEVIDPYGLLIFRKVGRGKADPRMVAAARERIEAGRRGVRIDGTSSKLPWVAAALVAAKAKGVF